MQEDKILEYLKLKISNFENKQQMGKMFFTCPNHQKHRFGRRPSATFRGESQRVVCAVCKFDGNIYDIVKTLEPSLSGLSDSEIDKHIIETISPNKLKILDIYEKNNWALIPVKENAKNPLEKGWTDSEHRDKSKWVGWLNKGYNIGINCGKSNIIVIDIDNKAFSQDVTPIREKIISLVKTANTLVQKTANGGEHYIFLADNDIPQFTDLLGTKIDSRTDGGQILIEPSKLEGKEYKWEDINSEIKPISEELKKELLKLCKKPVNTEIKQECSPAPMTDYSNVGDVVKIVKEGEGRNSLLTSIGGDLINKLEPDKTAYVLNVINNRFFNPPLAEHELNGMLTSLSGYKFSEEELQQRAVLDYMLMLNSETTVKDIMEVTRLPRRNVELVLTKLVKENKVNTFGRGRYRIKDKINWTDEIPTAITEWKYKMPFFHDVANFESTELLYLAAKTNDGKCITNGLLCTSRGLVDIEDIGKNKKEGISTDKGNHLRLFTGKLQDSAYRAPNYFWKEKVNKTVKITTEYGYEIEGTYDHKIVTLNPNPKNHQYNQEFKSLNNINIGDEVLICAPLHFSRPSSEKIINFDEQFIAHHAKKPTNFPNTITPNLARLVGYIIGDGTCSENVIHIFANKNNEKETIYSDIVNILKDFNIVPTIRTDGKHCLRISINSSYFLRWYKQKILNVHVNVKNVKSPQRIVPKVILEGNLEVQKNFISGLFSCESNLVKGNSIEICMSSKKMIDTLHIMLLNFGIFSRKSSRKVKGYPNKTYWRIYISSEYGLKFKTIFNPVKYQNLKYDKNIKRHSRIKTYGNNHCYKDVYMVDKIKSKEYINEEKYVYDFNMDCDKYSSNHQFWCNGFVNHNTSICMNILKQIIEQGLKPYYLYSETASRWNKIADKLGIAGKFYHCFHSNPMAIELEKNAFTIIDWLMIEHKEETDVVLKHLNDELRSKGGILIVMGQLKTNYDYFAPNLVDQFPTFAAKYIQDNQEKTHGHWELTKVKEPKLNNFIPNVECTYDFNTRLFIAKPVI